jgi:homoserine dehydrogenase
LRLRVEDHPGVLADVTGILGRHRISIASVIQHEPDTEGGVQEVPLVIMTHTAAEGAIQAAVAEINKLSSVRADTVRMRVLD